MSVTPQVSINGGAVQVGAVAAALNQTVQLTAASFSGWGVAPVARWKLYAFPPALTVPAGWTTHADGYYYFDGNSNPPIFTASLWGAYVMHLTAYEAGVATEARIMVDVPSPLGRRELGRGEGSLYGGSRLRWIKKMQENARVEETAFAAAAAPSDEAFSSVITLSSNATAVYSGAGVIAFSLAASGHANGKSKRYLIPAYTATAVYFAADLNQSGDAFDERYDFEAVVAYANGRASMVTKRILRPDAIAPELLYAYVPTSDPDTLVLVFTKAVVYTSTAGVTLSFSVGTPKTISSIRGYGADQTVIRLKLSGAIVSTDVFSVAFASGNTIKSGSSVALAAVTIGARWYTSPADLAGFAVWIAGNYSESSGQWPAAFNGGSHLLQQVSVGLRPADVVNGYDGAPVLRFEGKTFSADAGTDIITVASGHTFIADDVVNVRSEGGALPTGLSARTAYYVRDVVGSTFKLAASAGGAAINITSNGTGTLTIGFHVLLTTDALSTYVSASAALLFAVTVPKRITTNGGLPQQNDAVIGHGYLGIHARVTGTDAWSMHSYNFDGVNFDGYDTGKAIQLNTPVYARLRHESGNLYFRRDLAAESAPETSANTNSVGGSLIVGAGTSTTDQMDQDLIAWGALATIPAAHELKGIDTYFMSIPGGGFLRPKLRLPTKLYSIVGDTVRVYWEDVVLHANMAALTFATTGAAGSTTDNTLWNWAPATPGTYTLSVTASDVNTGLPVAAASVSVVVAAATGAGAVRYLQIGDSLTAGVGAAMSDRVRSALTADGMTVTMQGSKGGKNFTADAGTDTLTATAHGYTLDLPINFHPEPGSTLPAPIIEGTTYYARTIAANTFQIAAAPGGAAIDLTTVGAGSFYVRNPTTERHEGRAGWSATHFQSAGNGTVASPFVYYDGAITQSTDGAFDFASYVTAHLSGSYPTHVAIELGINDLLSSADAENPTTLDATIDTFLTKMERIISGIRAASATTKIAVVTIPPPNANQSHFDSDYPTGVNRWQWKRIQHRARERALWQFSGREVAFVYAVDVPVIDPAPAAGDYATSAVHPITQGSQRIGDQIAAWVRNNP